MKNKKEMMEKEFISSLMKDKVRGLDSERKLNKESKRSFADKNRSQNVLSLSTTSKYNKFLSFLLLFLIFSFIFMVIADEGGQIGEQEIFSKKGLLSTTPTSHSQWSVVQNTETDFFPIVFNKSAFSVRGGFT